MFKFFVLLAIAVIFSSCGDLGLDLTDAIKVQEGVHSDNSDANAAFECIKNVETDIDYRTGEVETVTIELEADCLADIAETKLPEELTEEDGELDTEVGDASDG